MPFISSFGKKKGRVNKTLSNESYYKSLIDNKQESSFLTDMEGEILLVNSKTEEFTGYPSDELTKVNARDVFVTIAGDDNPFDDDNFREFSKNLYLINSSNYLVPVLLELTEIEGGKFLGTIKPSEEIKGTEQAENRETSIKPTQNLHQNQGIENLHQKENADTRMFLSDEAEHVARNSLYTILGFSTVLLTDPSITGDKKLHGYVKSIIDKGNILKKMFNESGNTVSDSSDTNIVACSLSAIIQKTQISLQSLADKNNIELVIDMPGDFTVSSDENILFSVTTFLIEKAITFCRNSTVEIKTKPGQVDGQLMLIVDNLGQDIPLNIKNFIDVENRNPSYDFDNQIFSSAPKISSLLRNLNNINSKIAFETNSEFCDIALLTLPLHTVSETSEGRPQSNGSRPGDKKNALIIEDEKLNAMILKIYLDQYFNTSIAFSGNEALNIIELAYNKGIIFDIVFSDMGLPEPWDGIALKQEIINRWPRYNNIPFIAQTGYSAKSFGEKIKKSGFAGYLIKPINRNDIKKFVDLI